MNSRLMSIPLALLALAVLASGAGAQCELDKLTASDAAANDFFGNAVSLSGDRALAGATLDDEGGTASGSAYVFWLGACLSGPTPGIVAGSNTMTVSDATPYGLVGLSLGLGAGVTRVGPTCPGLGLDIDGAVLVGATIADVSGSAVIAGFVPASLSGTTIYLQAVDVAVCEVSNLVAHTFP